MSRLPDLLREAASLQATEVVLENGQPPLLSTPGGSVTLGGVYSESDLFDLLSAVLGEEQQVELAVGNPVEFLVDGEAGCWAMLAETGRDGVAIRGRRRSKERTRTTASVPAVELPPLEPFSPDDTPSRGIPAESFADMDLDLGDALSAPATATRTDLKAALGPPTVRLAAVDLDMVAMAMPSAPATPVAVSVAAPSSAVAIDAMPAMPPSPAPAPARPPSKTTIQAAAAWAPVPTQPAVDPDQSRLEEIAACMPPGTLCFVHQPGAARRLAAIFGPFLAIEDPYAAPTPTEALSAVAVCLEDPSLHLPWLLRRLEEGVRVLVETTARTPQGARRVILGSMATDRIEAWLDGHELCSLVRENGVLTLKGV